MTRSGTDPPLTVDIHTHMLPGVDDGSRDVEESLAMLEMASNDGTDAVVATPHAHHASREQTVELCERLTQLARERGLPTTILPGSEIRLGPDIFDAVDDGRYLKINNGPYVLIELPLGIEWPSYFEIVIARLRAINAEPVLAHAERYEPVQRDPDVVRLLVGSGVPVQINADALLGRQGRDEQRACERLLHLGLAHVIASDAHSAQHRPPTLSAGFARIGELCGNERVEAMKQCAWNIAYGFPVHLWPPSNVDVLQRSSYENWLPRLSKRLGL
jgi:protein-tyrosine phosphatase